MLQIGHTVYVGLGGRTNADGMRQLDELLAPLNRVTVAIPLTKVLHLKSAITALPDGSPVTWGDLVDRSPFPGVREVPEGPGAHVVPLGESDVLLPTTAGCLGCGTRIARLCDG